MRSLVKLFLVNLVKFLVSLRYRVKVKGLTEIGDLKGAIFLPNHPAEVDPVIVSSIIYNKFETRPLVTETWFNLPIIYNIISFARAIAVPDLEAGVSNYKKRRMEQVLSDMIADLKKGDNLLLYPAGRLQRSGLEKLKGASAVHTILEQHPDCKIVMVRTRGLWGSSFSVALTHGITPNVITVLKKAIKVLLKNLILFTPRRQVEIEFKDLSSQVPRGVDRIEFNKYLEDWYNEPGEEQLSFKSYAFWKVDIPDAHASAVEDDFDLDSIPVDVQEGVKREFAKMVNKEPDEIKPEFSIGDDLGLDSLDQSEILVWLDEVFDVQDVEITELISVASVMEIAAGRSGAAQNQEHVKAPAGWEDACQRPDVKPPEGRLLHEAFLNSCARMGTCTAVGDENTGVLHYKRLKMAALIMADVIKDMPGEKIGVMLPATVGVGIVSFACLLARKTPVMINWTLGPRNLQHIENLTGIEVVLTSTKFLDKLGNVELGDLEDKFVFLEDVKSNQVTIGRKIKGLLKSMKSTETLMRELGLNDISEDDPAVILFTSGSESVPKGVPLTHKNLLVNISDCINTVPFNSNDALYGFLPPFHSFGFTITTVLPITSGMKVSYYPNPNESRRLARGIRMWRSSTVCGTPAFMAGIFKAAEPIQLASLRYFITGAEKAPDDLFRRVDSLGVGAVLLEGYGITECAPVLTMNIPGKDRAGVGYACPAVELKIVDVDSREPLGQGERGLILARGENIFGGYLGKDAPNPFHEIEGNKWYVTGDLGFLDPNGALHLAGRLKRFVKVGGEMISLPAMEDVLCERWPAGEDGPVVAVESKDREGERPVLCLFSNLDITVEEANEALKTAGFSNVGRLNRFEKVEAIPLLGTGKTDYRSLKKILEENA